MFARKDIMISFSGRNGKFLINSLVVGNVLNGLCQFPGLSRRDVKTRDTMFVDPRYARLRNARGHHWFATRHGFNLHDAKSLCFLHAWQAEHLAGTEISRQVFHGNPPQQHDLVLKSQPLDFLLQFFPQSSRSANQDNIIVREIFGRING